MPEAGKIWAICRRKPGTRSIHLINLTDQTGIYWNAPRTPPGPCRDIALTVRALPPLDRALLLSPDMDHGRALPIDLSRDGDGSVLVVPRLEVWTTMLLLLDEERA
jgi:hypothetical protein